MLHVAVPLVCIQQQGQIASGTAIQVTKLCDLGSRDSVCAVHWTCKGSYLAVGTSLGDVQLKGEVGVFSRADGSALFEMGNTRVIAAV